MNKKSSRRWDIRHSESTSNFWTKGLSVPSFCHRERRQHGRFWKPAALLLTGHTTRRRAGCPRSLAHPAARWWLHGTKKRCPGLLGGGAGAHSLGEWSVGLDRPSQFRHCWLTRTLQRVALFLDNDLHFLDSHC